MSKIVIVGITLSGKTCYFYGMLNRMMLGYKGFSIRVAPENFGYLRRGIKRLGDTTLSMEERFPEPSSKYESYEMDLLYNLQKMDSFTWMDYPGENAELLSSEFVDMLNDANCLLLCVDGEAIQGTKEDVDNIVNDIYSRRGGLEINAALQIAADKNENGFPPVCIMITKYDDVSEELRNASVLSDIMKQSFPILFHPGKGVKRIVTICPVTLGKDIKNGGKLDPKNVEKPICFANYLVLANSLEEFKQQTQGLINYSQQALEAREKLGWLRKIITPKPEVLTEEQLHAIEELLKDGKQNLDALRSVIETLPLYIDGEETSWPD